MNHIAFELIHHCCRTREAVEAAEIVTATDQKEYVTTRCLGIATSRTIKGSLGAKRAYIPIERDGSRVLQHPSRELITRMT